jgi:hypothetical protein
MRHKIQAEFRKESASRREEAVELAMWQCKAEGLLEPNGG